MSRTVLVPEHHVISALDGYLQALGIAGDDEFVVSVKHDHKTDQYLIELENDE